MYPATPLPTTRPNTRPDETRSDCLLRRLDEILNRRPMPATLRGDRPISPISPLGPIRPIGPIGLMPSSSILAGMTAISLRHAATRDFRPSSYPSGIEAISRWLSAATPPDNG